VRLLSKAGREIVGPGYSGLPDARGVTSKEESEGHHNGPETSITRGQLTRIGV
jgi:hypothetical protein